MALQAYLSSTPYAGSQAASDAYDKMFAQVVAAGGDSETARQKLASQIQGAGDQFKNLFNNSVGRAPTQAEIDQFFSGSGDTLASDGSKREGQGLRDYTAQFIGDNFQQQAQDTATSKLSDLTAKYGGLADQYLEMGKTSLSSLADSLKSYQTSLFDKLRPQLNLSAQAQGIQDSGGQTLQERGALTDLGNQATATLLPFAEQVQNNANSIRAGGSAAPISLASSFAAGNPSALAGTGASALNFNNAVFGSNLDFAHQMAMAQFQAGVASNLQNNGFSFGNNFSKSFGSGLGTGLGGNISNIASGGLQGGLGSLGNMGSGAAAAPIG